MKLWENFYASTPQLIDNYLLKGVPVNASVLDPGAGKGDICDVLRKRAVNQYLPWEDFDHITDAHERVVKQMAKLKERGYSLRVSVIEINTDLQMILKGKGYPLIHDDFLTFDTRTPYDYIIANFPFSDGDKHLSKALDLIEQNGGELRCLVNAETLRNPYTNLRQQVVRRLEKRGAEVEYLGDMFRSAERPTGVEVAFIRVKAVVDPKFSFLLDELDRAQEVKLDEAPEQALAPREFIDLIVGKYKRECTLLVNAVNEFKAFESAMLAKIENGEEKGEPICNCTYAGRIVVTANRHEPT